MKVEKKELVKSQMEILVEVSREELQPYLEKGAQKVSEQVKVEGFRPGKAPYDILKQKIGEMTILEEAAHLFIEKQVDEIIKENLIGQDPVGQPQIEITKLAPGNAMEFKVILSLLPKISLGEYKGFNLKVEEVKVSKEELEKTLRDLREMRAQEVISEQPAKIGDKVIIDVEMFLDKVPIEGGQSKDVAVILGKDYFVPGFDKKLEGSKKDESREFSLLYPDNHHQANLAGKMVSFKVKTKEIYDRQVPELDDKFAAIFQFKNVSELSKALEENIEHEKKHQAEHKYEAEMLEKIISSAKFGDLPDILVNNEIQVMLGELEQSLSQQGAKLDDYLNHLKKSKDQLIMDFTPSALKRVKTALAIREIAIIEKIKVSGKEIDNKLEELKTRYKNQKEIQDMISQAHYRQYLENLLSNEKVIKSLKEWNYADSRDQQEG
ncbi:MAG: trigger factor [Patescibacteria group bacterium]